MIILLIGLALFLGIHSVRLFADNLRSMAIDQIGGGKWQAAYAIVSLVGIILIVYGYGQARVNASILWEAPLGGVYIVSLLMLCAFIMFAAVYVPGTHLKARIGHPMLVGVKLWAFSHLIVNGGIADVFLLGSFLLWAILCFKAARKRDQLENRVYEVIGVKRDLIAIGIGFSGLLVFSLFFHQVLIGVPVY